MERPVGEASNDLVQESAHPHDPPDQRDSTLSPSASSGEASDVPIGLPLEFRLSKGAAEEFTKMSVEERTAKWLDEHTLDRRNDLVNYENLADLLDEVRAEERERTLKECARAMGAWETDHPDEEPPEVDLGDWTDWPKRLQDWHRIALATMWSNRSTQAVVRK